MEAIQQVLADIRHFLEFPLLKLGGAEITLWTIVYVIGLLAVLLFITAKLRNWIVNSLFARSSMELGVRQAIGSIIRYAIITVGFVVILQTAGLDLSALTILAGALGIGVGIGLQDITSNFISGIIILLERPIKVGDRIEVGSVVGNVVTIALRATTVVTNDNIAIIVPNSDFISSKVTNWSYTNRDVRFNIRVGVSYGSDVEKVKRILLAVAAGHDGVLEHPGPDVIFEEFGDSSLNFILRVWTRDYTNRPLILRSEINFAIRRTFTEEGVEIPFPQRDLHIRSGAIELKTPTSPA